jgi:hypothetical protein
MVNGRGEMSEIEILKNDLKSKITINKNGCWIWNKSPSQYYGEYRRIINDKRFTTAHRASYYLFKGDIPEGMFVLHKCSEDHKLDNSKCINPDHLYLGTHEDNMRDMAISEVNKGENNPMYGKIGTRTGVELSEDTKNILREKNLGENNPMYGKRGRNNPNYGKKRSEDTKRLISENRKGKLKGHSNPSSKVWKVISPNNNEFIIDNLLKFCKENEINYSSFITNKTFKKWSLKKWI